MSLNSKFKILLVISASQIESYRGQCVLSSINRMKNMFPNLNELEKAIGLVITKGEKELTGIDYIEQLKEKSDPELLKWCNFFTSNPDRVFVFPEASKNDIGKNYDFDDHNRLLSFLQSNQITNPSHKISLSENATLYLKNIQNCINQETKNISENIFNKICDDYRKKSNSKEIDKWIKIMNQLNELVINSVDDVREFFNKKIPNNSEYNQFFEKLNESKDLNDFICNALGESKRASNLIKSIKELTGEALSELNQNYEKAKIYEKQERKRIEYEKQMEIKRKEEERKRKKKDFENKLKYRKKKKKGKKRKLLCFKK